jgi:hypothetical protein
LTNLTKSLTNINKSLHPQKLKLISTTLSLTWLLQFIKICSCTSMKNPNKPFTKIINPKKKHHTFMPSIKVSMILSIFLPMKKSKFMEDSSNKFFICTISSPNQTNLNLSTNIQKAFKKSIILEVDMQMNFKN